MGLTLIVDNIGDEAVRAQMLAAGVPLGQGALYGAPMPVPGRRLCRSEPRCRLRFARAAARQMPCRPRPLLDPAIPLIQSIAPLAEGTAAWLVDIWGVIHNGVKPFADACEACARYRQSGGIVVLVSNSPRPHGSVAAQLDGIGVPRATWDTIVTSGDVARTLIARYSGRPIFMGGGVRVRPGMRS